MIILKCGSKSVAELGDLALKVREHRSRKIQQSIDEAGSCEPVPVHGVGEREDVMKDKDVPQLEGEPRRCISEASLSLGCS
ncbi:hypothetical protein FVE85_8491 [Porphyridium purpureum]|uniref:Uncharacterized protein n=1 Tax=Porphyridium purpureum TaxID=35688 RepID=A0A5J4YKL3_PORPP|nr:hypothetical protein FVE85_8491 [Porphyridium purpureum]|eukprot:POR9835..scf244_11